jgi:hypothetical protein
MLLRNRPGDGPAGIRNTGSVYPPLLGLDTLPELPDEEELLLPDEELLEEDGVYDRVSLLLDEEELEERL